MSEPSPPSLAFNEEQQMLSDSLLGFLGSMRARASVRAVRDAAEPVGYSADAWRKFCAAGYAATSIAEDHGGAGLGGIETAIVARELGRALIAFPFATGSVAAAAAIEAAGSEAQQISLLPAIAAGHSVATLAVEENSKHQPGRIDLNATPAHDGFVLDGTKKWVPWGAEADLLVVTARLYGGVAFFCLDKGRDRMAIEPVTFADATRPAHVRLDAVRVPLSALLGSVADGSATLHRSLDKARVAIAAELVGLAEAVFARTLEYLRQRRQFGKFIGEFQGLQHRAAHLHVQLAQSWAAVLGAARTIAQPHADARLFASVAKARACDAASLAIEEGIQMHGGIGMTDDIDLGLYAKRARVLQEAFGDKHFHHDRIASLNGY